MPRERNTPAQKRASAKWKAANPKKLTQQAARYNERHRQDRRDRARVADAARRAKVLQHYGGCCACCSETEETFLTLDHIENDGALRRKEQGSGSQLYKWIVRNGYPEGFQVLCWNCNWGKQRHGVCPHQALQLRVVNG